ERGGDELEDSEGEQELPAKLAVHGLVHRSVASSHNLVEAEIADESNEQAGHGGLAELGPARKRAQARAQIAERAGEGDGEESADDSEHGIGDQLAAVAKVDGGNAEDRLGAEESALHNRAGD